MILAWAGEVGPRKESRKLVTVWGKIPGGRAFEQSRNRRPRRREHYPLQPGLLLVYTPCGRPDLQRNPQRL